MIQYISSLFRKESGLQKDLKMEFKSLTQGIKYTIVKLMLKQT